MNIIITAMTVAAVLAGSKVRSEDVQPTILRITDFGAAPNSGEDATFALRDALRTAKNFEAPHIIFEPGRYDFTPGAHPDHSHHPGFVEGIDNLTIDGQGAELFFQGLTSPFFFRDCRNLVVRHLSIDWDHPLFMQGEVIATGTNYFDLRVDPAFPVHGGEPVQAYQDFDPETRLPRIRGIDQYDGVTHTEKIDDHVLRVHVHPWARKPETGFLAVLRNQIYASNAFYFSQCDDVTVENVTVYHAPGMAFVGHRSHNVTLRDCAVRIRPGSGRLVSTNADGSHFNGCTGLIRIQNCLFEGMGDDAVNIKSGLYLTIQEGEGDHAVVGRHNLQFPDPPNPGDLMEFLGNEHLLPYATLTVSGVEKLPHHTYRIHFTEPLDGNTAPGHVIGNVSRLARAHISNVTVRNNRARGFLIQTRGAVIEDCHFENITTGGIFVMTEIVHFFESIGPRDVIVRNNVFENVGFGSPPGEGVIMVFAFLSDYRFPPVPGVIRDIRLENNIIRGGNSSGIFVAGVDGIEIRKNRIIDTCAAPHRPDKAGAIFIMSSRNVTLAGNTVRLEDQAQACQAALLLGPGNELESFHDENCLGSPP